jgi:hypothetical protein
LINIPEAELSKLDGMLMHCDCCSHINLLKFRPQGQNSGINIIPIRLPVRADEQIFEDEQVLM